MKETVMSRMGSYELLLRSLRFIIIIMYQTISAYHRLTFNYSVYISVEANQIAEISSCESRVAYKLLVEAPMRKRAVKL